MVTTHILTWTSLAEDIDAEDIHVDDDSVSFINARTHMRMSVHLRGIEGINLIQYGGGAVEGFLFGAFGGMLAGGAIEKTIIDGSGHGGPRLGGLLVGGLIGAAVGAILGHTQVVMFPEKGLLKDQKEQER